MPLKKGASEQTVSDNVAELMRAGYDKGQAVAIAKENQRKSKRKPTPQRKPKTRKPKAKR